MTTALPTAVASAETTVNDLLARLPAAATTLNAFGIDTCCGGHASLREAAAEAMVPLPALLELLAAQAREGGAPGWAR